MPPLAKARTLLNTLPSALAKCVRTFAVKLLTALRIRDTTVPRPETTFDMVTFALKVAFTTRDRIDDTARLMPVPVLLAAVSAASYLLRAHVVIRVFAVLIAV